MKNTRTRFTVIDGGRKELERRLVETFFTPFKPDNEILGSALAEQLKPRLNARDLTLFSQEPLGFIQHGDSPFRKRDTMPLAGRDAPLGVDE